jgi:outer membrane putative beta-barrel porin/alpha-amylase
MKKHLPWLAAAIITAAPMIAKAHGPLFSPAPETIFKGGTELTLGFDARQAKGAGKKEQEYQPYMEAKYGLTADWEIGIEVPYAWKEQGGAKANGIGDITLGTKYQFWQRNLPGAQYKAAAFVQAELPTGKDDSRPRLGSGSVDATAGVVTGYESRRWYWFASGVYRVNTEGAGNLEKGDRQFLNLVGGIRPVLTDYKEPDTVLMLEMHWERAGRDTLNGASLADTGGWEMFLSPVVWWTYRQVAVRGGVQIPVAESLNGDQATSDYRARLELVYHF